MCQNMCLNGFLSNSPIFFSLLEVCFIFQVKALNSLFFMLLFLFIGCIIFSKRKCSHIISSSEVFLVFIELFAMNYGHMKTFYYKKKLSLNDKEIFNITNILRKSET